MTGVINVKVILCFHRGREGQYEGVNATKCFDVIAVVSWLRGGVGKAVGLIEEFIVRY